MRQDSHRPDQTTRRQQLVVGLLWHSVNSDNLGVGALTQSHIAILEGIAGELGLDVRFLVLGWFDRREPYAIGANIRVVPLRGRHFLPGADGLFAAVRGCDLVCDIGAGDSFSDIYGLRRFGFMAMSKAIVLAAGRPLILAPQTIGPFRRPGTARIARALMRRCHVVAVRDEPSLTRLDGARTRTVLATDVAFRLPFEAPRRDDNLVHVGVNVSGLLFNGGYDRANMFGLRADYQGLIRSLLGYFSGQSGCQVHLIGHVITDGEIEDDYRVGVALAVEFPKTVVAPRFRGPQEAKSYFAGMDFVCGSRMHACIAALSAGVPVLPISYSPKFEGLFGSIGYRHVADCCTETAESVLAKVIDAFEHRDQLRRAAAAANRTAAERLSAYETVLRHALGAAALSHA